MANAIQKKKSKFSRFEADDDDDIGEKDEVNLYIHSIELKGFDFQNLTLSDNFGKITQRNYQNYSNWPPPDFICQHVVVAGKNYFKEKQFRLII